MQRTIKSEMFLSKAIQELSSDLGCIMTRERESAAKEKEKEKDKDKGKGKGKEEEMGKEGKSSTRVMMVLQAQVLLINYFFGCARFVEAKSYLNAAVCLATSFKLHQLRPTTPPLFPAPPHLFHHLHHQETPFTSNEGPTNITNPLINPIRKLNKPRDLVEEGERVQAFWVVYVLDQTWSVAFAEYAFMVEDGSLGRRIDTDWAERGEDYEQVGFLRFIFWGLLMIFWFGLVIRIVYRRGIMEVDVRSRSFWITPSSNRILFRSLLSKHELKLPHSYLKPYPSQDPSKVSSSSLPPPPQKKKSSYHPNTQ